MAKPNTSRDPHRIPQVSCTLQIKHLSRRVGFGSVFASLYDEFSSFCVRISIVLTSATGLLPHFGKRKSSGGLPIGNSRVFTFDVLTFLSGSRPDFAIMEIGRECWPLFLGFDVRSIGEKGHRRVHDHGNYAFGLDKAHGRRHR